MDKKQIEYGDDLHKNSDVIDEKNIYNLSEHYNSRLSRFEKFTMAIKSISSFELFVFFVIMACEAGSWNLSFIGANHFMPNYISFIFAFGIQAAIIVTLYNLNKGKLGSKILMISIYILCFSFSVGSAYITAFNTSISSVKTNLNNTLIYNASSDYFSQINEQFYKIKTELLSMIEEQKNILKEEKEYGSISKKGPGVGPVYLKKDSDLKKSLAQLALIEKEETLYKKRIANYYEDDKYINTHDLSREFYNIISQLPNSIKDKVNPPQLSGREKEFQALPHEIAWNAIINGSKEEKRQALFSLFTGAVLELIALFMGILRTINKSNVYHEPSNMLSRLRQKIIVYLSEIILFKNIQRDATERAAKHKTIEDAKLDYEFKSIMDTVHRVITERSNYVATSEELKMFWQNLVLVAAQYDSKNPENVISEINKRIGPINNMSQSGIKKEYINRFFPHMATFLISERVFHSDDTRDDLVNYYVINTDLNNEKYLVMVRCIQLLSNCIGKPEDQTGFFKSIGESSPKRK